MADKSNIKTIVGWSIAGFLLLLSGVVVWWVWFKDACDPNNKGYTKKGKISEKCVGETNKSNTDPSKETSPPPSGCQWISDNTFPLKRCMIGDKIGALQTALGFTGTAVDKKFGNDTLGRVQSKFNGRSEVTQAEYNSLINPPTTAGGNNFQELKKQLVLGTDFSGGLLYEVDGQNKKYQFAFYAGNGRFIMNELGKTTGYIQKGTYSNGGKKMVVDGGNTYESIPQINMRDIVKDYGQ